MKSCVHTHHHVYIHMISIHIHKTGLGVLFAVTKSRMNITVDQRLREEFKEAVGSGNMSEELTEFMKRRVDSDGSIEDRLSSLRSKRHELLSRLEEKQKELDELKDEINRTDQEIENLEEEREQKKAEKENAKQRFVEMFEERLGDKITSAEDVDHDYWKERTGMDAEELFSLLESEVSQED